MSPRHSNWIYSNLDKGIYCSICKHFLSEFVIAYMTTEEVNNLLSTHDLTHQVKPKVSPKNKRIWRAR